MKGKNKMKIKEKICTIIFSLLGKAFSILPFYDTLLQQEINTLKEGMKIKVQIGKKGSCICLTKQQGRIVREEKNDKVDLLIQFKGSRAAFFVLIGKKSIAQAYAEHRFILKGEIASAMSLVRSINRIEQYLFPKCFSKKLFQKQSSKELSFWKTYWVILFSKKGETNATKLLRISKFN